MIAGEVEPKLVVEIALLQERQDCHDPAELSLVGHIVRTDHGRRKLPVRIVVVVKRQADLFQVIAALRAPRGFTRRLRGWQQQRDKHANDGDDYE